MGSVANPIALEDACTMLYPRYFKPGQKVLLRSLAADPGRLDALTAYFQGGAADYFDFNLPYRAQGEEAYPFAPEMPFEILSDALGMGVRVTGRFDSRPGEETIRLRINSDLQMFKRRINVRLDTNAGLRYTKGKGALRTFREQWAKNVEILGAGGKEVKLPDFPRCQVNLSAGGIRFCIKPPIEIADICLLLLELDDGAPPICVMAEVVWMDEKETQGRRTVGMQFLNVLQADQERIQKYIRRQEPADGAKAAG